MRNTFSRGGVLPLVALCLAALLGFAGLSVDVGFLEYKQQAQQSATDAAAMGAAQQLVMKGCNGSASATTVADTDALSNAYGNGGNGGNVAVSVHNPPLSGPYAGNNCAVSVTITSGKISTWFSRGFGFAGGATETTQAVGLVSYTGPGCLYLLNTSQQNDLTNLNIQSPKCGIYMNTSANMSNSTINVSSLLYAGLGSSVNNVSGTTFQGASPAVSLPFADPCQNIPGCAYLTQNSPATSGYSNNGNYNGTGQFIGSATQTTYYNTLTISGTNETVCGLIEITGNQFHLNGATINTCPSGVTFAMSSNTQDTNFGNCICNLTAPTSGNTANVVMWRTPSQSSAVDISHCTCAWTGALYLPTAQVDVSNIGSTYSVLIFGQANFSNSSDFNDTIPSTGSFVGTAVLAQ